MKQNWMNRNELANLRDTIESVWVAIILAFVLRAFVVEAFDIPTGSMAPRLMGQHLLLDCPECKTEFPFGIQFDNSVTSTHITGPVARCPNCGQEIRYQQAQPKGGDRVLVIKYLYKFHQPQRWDVVVFKDPQGNKQNYIKRLAGLPGEVIRIIHGDVFVYENKDLNGNGILDEWDATVGRDENGQPQLDEIENWRVARKPHATQKAMWQLVFDNDFRPAQKGRRTEWAEPWQAESDGWDLSGNHGRVFQYQGPGEKNLQFARGEADVFMASNAYNSRLGNGNISETDICSDLKLQTTVLPAGTKGKLLLTLSNLEHEFAGEIDFNGQVRLLHRQIAKGQTDWAEAEQWGKAAVGAFAVGRAVRVALVHADWRVTLWVDDKPVLSSSDELYSPDVPALVARIKAGQIPVPRVGITGAGGKFELWHTSVMRDVYYTCPKLYNPPRDSLGRYARQEVPAAQVGKPGWGTMNNPIALRAYDSNPDMDEFFMLGDNSPASLDSRMWVKAAPTLRLYDAENRPLYRLGTVPRYNLTGKALFVYWPAAFRLPWPGNLSIVPNAGKMRAVH
ncbi:MAG: signal peptidase I [Planctomycetes bacterium]|nr:signal peptidase I [Planctomycetota bacterium]